MTWTLQLTLWALPPILAVLLAVRDATFLWPRRREGGTPALLTVSAAAGAWAILDLGSVVSADLGVKLLATRVEYLPAAAATAAWAWFAVAFPRRPRDLLAWPLVALYGACLAVALASLGPGTWPLLVREAHLVPVGGVAGLQVSHGPAHWIFVAVRSTAVLAATWTVSRHVVRIHGIRLRTPLAGTAGLVALVPPFVPLLLAPGAEWMDLSSTGFALSGSFLAWGLMRPQILNLGPVDREVVLRELRDPLVVMDGRGQLVDVNRTARDELGLRPYGDVPLTLGTLWARGPQPPGTPPSQVVLPEDGEGRRIYEVTLTPLDDDGSRRMVLLLRDVTASEHLKRELRRANAELERLALTDSLTGLANRRHFMERLEAEVERAQRYHRPLSVVLLDLDHFKKVNDTHGHAAGDEVLRGAARALRSVCRDVDIPARWGGEELALLLPETDAAGARIVAERVRERIQAQAYTGPSGGGFGVTASLGVATADESGLSAEALLHASDKALYRAKDEGRNRVVLAG
ncbi:MAG: hypothetical protein AMXMBFR53_42560 [Gemmatimonadota bacterium]